MVMSITKLYIGLDNTAEELKNKFAEDKFFQEVFILFKELCDVGRKVESSLLKAETRAAEVRIKEDFLMSEKIGLSDGHYKFNSEPLILLAEKYIKALELLKAKECKFTFIFTKDTPQEDLDEIDRKLPILKESVKHWRNELSLAESKLQPSPLKPQKKLKKKNLTSAPKPQQSNVVVSAQLLMQIQQICSQGCKYHSTRLYYLSVAIGSAATSEDIQNIVKVQVQKASGVSPYSSYIGALFHRLAWVAFKQDQLKTRWHDRGESDDFKEKLDEINRVASAPTA